MNRKLASKSSNQDQDWWHEIVCDGPIYRSADMYITAIERCLDEDVQRNLNKLDSHGTTALHEAVNLKRSPLVRNAMVEALLWCGSDINVVDVHGKTALVYLPTDTIVICADHFLKRINALACLKLPICEQNRRWYHDWHESVYGYGPEGNASVDEIRGYVFYRMFLTESRYEISVLRETRVKNRITLYHVLNGASDEQVICLLKELKSIVSSYEFIFKFETFGGLIKQRYRTALFTLDINLKPLVMYAVEMLCKLPDLCNEVIADYLPYDDCLCLLEALKLPFSYDSIGNIYDYGDFKGIAQLFS